MTVVHDLHEQTVAARTLLEMFADVLADDEQAKADMVEGETSLNDVMCKAVERLAAVDAMQEQMKAMIDRIAKRRDRLANQAEMLRTGLLEAMNVAGIKTLEHALARITKKATPPSAVITDEAFIPSKFFVPVDPKLDKRALLAALKEGASIPGAQLSNGGETLQIRWG